MTACACGSHTGHGTAVANAACVYLQTCRDAVVKRAAEHGIPPHLAGDLFAHLSNIYADGSLAFTAALNVMDLGWRPTASDLGAVA